MYFLYHLVIKVESNYSVPKCVDGLKIIVIFFHKTNWVQEIPRFHLFLIPHPLLTKEDRICHFVRNHLIYLEPQ